MTKRKISRFKVFSKIPSTSIKAWEGIHPDPTPGVHYDAMYDGNVDIYDKTGDPIACVRRGIFTDEQLDSAYPAFRHMRDDRNFWSDNRGQYSGQIERIHKVKKDGTISRQGRCKSIASGIAGYYESIGGRFKFPRETAFLQKHPDLWELMQPIFRISARWMQTVTPKRYANQMEAVKKTSSDWVIKDTPYTTITVNNCVASAYHTDNRDLKDGMGCLMVFRRGEYKGFELVLPEYRVALNLRHGDLLFFNPCAWHGNIPVHDAVGEEGEDWERISVVMYFRKNLMKEPPKAEALARVKERESKRYMGLEDT